MGNWIPNSHIDYDDIKQTFQLKFLESQAKGKFTVKQSRAWAKQWVRHYKTQELNIFYRKQCAECDKRFHFSYYICPDCGCKRWILYPRLASLSSMSTHKDSDKPREVPSNHSVEATVLSKIEIEQFMSLLPDDISRNIVQVLLEGGTQAAAAERIGFSREGVGKRMEKIRKIYRRYEKH